MRERKRQGAGYASFCLLSSVFCLLSSASSADRVVLAPEANPLNPDSFKFEFQIAPWRGSENRAWFQMGTPEGLELEFNRAELSGVGKKRHSFNLQYPLVYDLGPNPALSIGVRDLFGTGVERQSLFVALGKSVPLPDRTALWLRSLQLNAGAGTGTIGGVFVGVQARFRHGLSADAEIFRNRANVSLGLPLPLVRNAQARAYSVNGEFYYGLTYTLIR